MVNLKKSAPYFFLVVLIQLSRIDYNYSPSLAFLFLTPNVLAVIFMVMIAPFYEEVFYRGCLFDFLCFQCDAIGAGQGKIVPTLITSLIFSVMHTQFTTIADYSFAFVISIILIRVRIITKGFFFL